MKAKIQVKKLKPHIIKILPNEKWNFDLEDCDKILLIDGEENIVLSMTDLLLLYRPACRYEGFTSKN